MRLGVLLQAESARPDYSCASYHMALRTDSMTAAVTPRTQVKYHTAATSRSYPGRYVELCIEPGYLISTLMTISSMDAAGLPSFMAGKKRQLFKASSSRRLSRGLGVGLTSSTVTVPSAST